MRRRLYNFRQPNVAEKSGGAGFALPTLISIPFFLPPNILGLSQRTFNN